MKMLYVDMDGVITDFEERYFELFNEDPKATRDKKNGNKGQYSENWHHFVRYNHFATLDWHKGGKQLVEQLEDWELTKRFKVEIKILTSSGGTDRHNEVAKQKLKWVEDKFISWPVVVVPGRRYKQLFANDKSFIIDDTEDVIIKFKQNGGHGVLHTGDTDNTLKMVEEFLARK